MHKMMNNVTNVEPYNCCVIQKSQPIYCKQHTTPTHGYMKPQNNTTASHWKGEKLRLQFTL